jgi:hypothetical protein
MNRRRLAVLAALGLAQGAVAAGPAGPGGAEFNAWPFVVERPAPPAAGPTGSWSAAGPLLFREPSGGASAPGTARGLRPFWVELDRADASQRSRHFLYPLFNWSEDGSRVRWSVFELIRRESPKPGVPRDEFAPQDEFDLFPFWFERRFSEPSRDYRAFFPLHGTLRDKLWFERASWTLFPLYAESERRGAVTRHTPWPFIRTTRGAAQGWGVWPFYTTYDRPGVVRETFAPWPLVYRSTRPPHPDDPPGTAAREDFGVLPFYSRSTGPGFASENYLWPFFGYTDRTAPKAYREQRYLWPFLVQGRGEERHVNRWAPFYTHSIVQGREKNWLLWPLFRQARWTEEGVDRARQQFLYFLYWQEQQRAAGREHSPVAGLTHVWPFASHWDNGAGRRQWQLFSPLEVFFPGNEKVRQAWTPLFALARHDEIAGGRSRTALLWNAITWERDEPAQRREFHLGPLLGVAHLGAAKRFSIGNGLVGFHRDATGGWQVRWFDFPRRADSPALP